MSLGDKISIPGALLVIVCFFLPWITVSCEGRPIATLSGYRMAAGSLINTPMGTQTIGGDLLFVLILVAGILCLGLLLAAYMMWTDQTVAAIGQLLLTAVAIGVLVLKWSQLRAEAARVGTTVSPQIGLWGTILGYVLVVVGAVLDLTQTRRRPTPPSYWPPRY